MIGTIRNWFYSRVLNRHRLLFRYWNGSRFICEDPFVLFRKLLNTQDFDLSSDLKAVQLIPDPKIIVRKIEHIARGVREIFQIPDLSAGGLSELECVQLLLEFLRWSEALKKNGVTSPIAPGSIQTSGKTASGEVAENNTSENSDSTSTECESGALPDGRLQSELELQSADPLTNSCSPESKIP